MKLREIIRDWLEKWLQQFEPSISTRWYVGQIFSDGTSYLIYDDNPGNNVHWVIVIDDENAQVMSQIHSDTCVKIYAADPKFFVKLINLMLHIENFRSCNHCMKEYLK